MTSHKQRLASLGLVASITSFAFACSQDDDDQGDGGSDAADESSSSTSGDSGFDDASSSTSSSDGGSTSSSGDDGTSGGTGSSSDEDTSGTSTGSTSGTSEGSESSSDTGSSESSSTETSTSGTTTGGGEPVRVRFVHAAVDAPALDVYVDGETTPIMTALNFATTSGDFELPNTVATLQFRAAGSDATTAAAFDLAVDWSMSEAFTVIAGGVFGSSDAADSFRAVTLAEDFVDPGVDAAVVRVVHFGVDVAEVDIDAAKDGNIDATGLGRFSATAVEGIEVAAGAVRLGVNAGGAEATAFTVPEVTATSQRFAVLTGRLSLAAREAGALSLLVVDEAGDTQLFKQDPEVYVLHAVPDAGSVAGCVDGIAFTDAFAFGDALALRMSPGVRSVGLPASSAGCADAVPAAQQTGNLVAGERYLVVASGETTAETDESSVAVHTYLDRFAVPGNGRSLMRVVHAASAPTVDVGSVANGAVHPNYVFASMLAWGNESDELDEPAGNYACGAAASGSMPLTALVEFRLPFPDGARTFGVAAGDLTPESGEAGIRMVLVNTSMSPWSFTEVQPD